MSQVSIGHSHPKPCHGMETLKRCRNNEDVKNVVLIDVDSEYVDNVINNDVPESLRKKLRGPSRKDEWSFSNVIHIDDEEETPVNQHSGVCVNNNASTSRNSYTATTVEESYCDLMEDFSGKVQEQWEKAFSKRRKDVNNGYSGVANDDSTSKGINGNLEHAKKGPFSSSTRKSNSGNEVPSFSMNLDADFDFCYVFDNPILDDYSLDSLLNAHLHDNNYDVFPQSDPPFVHVDDFCSPKAFTVENESKYQNLLDPLENMQWPFEKIPLSDLIYDVQAEEAQRIRRLRERKEAESMHLLDIQKRQKERLEEVHSSQKQDEVNMNLKEVIRAEVRNHLKKLEVSCQNMSSLLHCLGICVGGWPHPLPQQVQTAYKKALLTFHPDRASRSDIRQQVEAEEKFKLVNRLKEKFPLML